MYFNNTILLCKVCIFVLLFLVGYIGLQGFDVLSAGDNCNEFVSVVLKFLRLVVARFLRLWSWDDLLSVLGS